MSRDHCYNCGAIDVLVTFFSIHSYLSVTVVAVTLYTSIHTIMPKKSWATEEQLVWLYAQLPDFRLAQEAKTTPSFFAKIYQDFHSQWPVPPPTSEEIAAEDGNDEKAQTTKEKASESVSGLLSLIWLYLSKILNIHTCQRIHFWVYNKSRGSSSGTGARGVLNLKGNPRLLQPWQAFAKLFGEDLKSKVENEWQKYQEANPNHGYTNNDRFEFHNKKMQEWYEESDSKAKKEVAEYRVQYKEGFVDGDSGDDPNLVLQK
jgi:hypothetical protein